MPDLALRRGLRPATVAATLAMVVCGFTSACGATQPPVVAAPAVPVSSGTGGSPAEPDPSSSANADPSPSTDPESGTGDAASDQQFCQAISLNLAFLTKAATSPDDPTLDQGIAKIRKLAETAPAEIRNDLTVIADFDQRVLDELHAGQRPEIKETPELTAALSHEAKWTAAHC